MLNFNSYFSQGVNSTLKIKQGTNWSYKGQWLQIYDETEIDRWYVGDFSSASYQITVEFNSNKKEVLHALVVARPSEASVSVYGRVSIDDELITLSATVNDSYLSLKATPSSSIFDGAKLIFLATYSETINELTIPTELTYLLPQEETPGTGGGGGGGGGGGNTTNYLDDLLDVTITSPVQDQILTFNGSSWVNSTPGTGVYAPINNPTFTGTVSGITAAMVGLGNVTNESKATMFTSPAFTGIVSGITPAMIGLGNVINESKTTMFTDSTLTGDTNIETAYIDGLSIGGSTPITAISTDATLSAASSTTLSTQSAVKSYVDNAISVITINSNNTNLTGTTTIQQTSEVLNTKTSSTGTVDHDFLTGAIWVHSSITSNFIANFTNVPTTNNRSNIATLVLLQGATPYSITALQIAGVSQTINWLNAAVPTPLANRKEIYSFALIRSSSSWTVIGSLSSYG